MDMLKLSISVCCKFTIVLGTLFNVMLRHGKTRSPVRARHKQHLLRLGRHDAYNAQNTHFGCHKHSWI